MPFTAWIRRFISRRKLYPPSKLDRLILWAAWCFVSLIYFAGSLYLGLPLFSGFYSTKVYFVGMFSLWVFVYVTQTPPKDEFGGYVAKIADIERIGGELGEIVQFLKQERDKVAAAQETLQRLRNEKNELEPVVIAERDTVNAILAAYAKATATRVWKERLVGFISGLIASLVAAMVFEYFKR